MKKGLKITIIIIIILSILVYAGYKKLGGPSVKLKDKIEIKKYVESYLTKKYGEHKFRVTSITYEYNKTTLFDYSSPKGYWVYFKSDVVPRTWLTIKGLISDEYKIDNDYFIKEYYFPDDNGYDVYKALDNMKPKEKIETKLLNELQNEFDSNAYKVECEEIILDIPEDYGKIPTLEEIKTNTNLYKVLQFDYKVSNSIKDTYEYTNQLKSYITNKYNSNSTIYFHYDNTMVSIFLEE